MSETDVMRGGTWISTNPMAAASASLSLPAPAAGQCHQIAWIACYAAGATAADLNVKDSAGNSLLRLGGVGTSALGLHLFDPDRDSRGALMGKLEDATAMTLTTTLGNPTQITCAWQFVPA